MINYNAGAGAREVPVTPPAGSGGRRISTQVSLYDLIRILLIRVQDNTEQIYLHLLRLGFHPSIKSVPKTPPVSVKRIRMTLR
jgi:hypothetical protein